MSLRTTLISLAVLAFAAFPAAAAPADDEAAVQAAQAAVQPHFDGIYLDGSAEAPALLDAAFAAVRRWGENYLAAHPTTTAEDFTAAIRNVAGEAKAIKLPGGAFLVSQPVGEAGQVFILAPGAGGVRTAWSAETFADQAQAGSPLKAWSSARARDNCRDGMTGEAWRTCGPLNADIGALPATQGGKARFYVNATYAQPAGATLGAQISIWTWDGVAASLDYAGVYNWEADQAFTVRLEGQVLHVRQKDDFKTFFACGACEGRQLDWSLRIGPAGVQDLGKRSLTPDLDIVDTLLDRTLRRAPTTTVASPAVSRLIGQKVDAVRKDLSPTEAHPSLGMLMSSRSRAVGAGRTVCIAIDGLGTYRFTLAGKGLKQRIVAVKDLGDTECGDAEGAA